MNFDELRQTHQELGLAVSHPKGETREDIWKFLEDVLLFIHVVKDAQDLCYAVDVFRFWKSVLIHDYNVIFSQDINQERIAANYRLGVPAARSALDYHSGRHAYWPHSGNLGSLLKSGVREAIYLHEQGDKTALPLAWDVHDRSLRQEDAGARTATRV